MRMRIDPSDVESIRYHDELPENLIERIKRVAEIFKEVHPISVDEWVDGFKYDMHPEEEVAVWETMATKFGNLCQIRQLKTMKDKMDIFEQTLEEAIELDPIAIAEREPPTA